MTLDVLYQIIDENNIPEDVHLMSDSGWECAPTEMNGIFYNQKSNTIVFTQGECSEREYEQLDEWEVLYVPGLIKIQELEVYPSTNAIAYGLTEAYKKAIKAAGDFESYYGVRETDDAYNKIDLRRPLFYCIKIKGSFIGYIGFNGNEEMVEPEIYIFEPYRNKGYGTLLMKRFIDMAFEEGLSKNKTLFPSKLVSTVRVENIYSRRMMTACGFDEDNDVATEFEAFIGAGKDDEYNFNLIEVVKYYITKDKYLESKA